MADTRRSGVNSMRAGFEGGRCGACAALLRPCASAEELQGMEAAVIKCLRCFLGLLLCRAGMSAGLLQGIGGCHASGTGS